MNYRAVLGRAAVSLDSLQLPLSDNDALKILSTKGFKIIDINLVALARSCIGWSVYRRGARPSEAPAVVDCSSFVRWIYGQRGIWLPRRSIQQRECGEEVAPDEIITGDLVFVSGQIDYYSHDPSDGVGHVGIATGEGTVVHAANKRANIIETPYENFVGKTKFRGIRRYIPCNQNIITLETPPQREVESSDDVRWIILQSLSKSKP